jgi:hypothetical protein
MGSAGGRRSFPSGHRPLTPGLHFFVAERADPSGSKGVCRWARMPALTGQQPAPLWSCFLFGTRAGHFRMRLERVINSTFG